MVPGWNPSVIMIITLGGVKGGEGKSTLATNLTICRSSKGLDVLLVDADKQRSASDFTLARKETLKSGSTGYTAIQLRSTAVRDEVQRLASKYDDIIIDLGGRDTVEQRAAIAISQVYAIPVVPSSYDLWALEQVAFLIEEGRAFNGSVHALCFLNKSPSRGKDIEQAIAINAIYKSFKTGSTRIQKDVWSHARNIRLRWSKLYGILRRAAVAVMLLSQYPTKSC